MERIATVDAGQSVAALLESQAACIPDSAAFICGSRRHTFGSLDRAANQVAGALIRAGVAPGQRVAFWGRNCLEALELLAGAAKAGAVCVMVNWRLSIREAGFVLSDSAVGVVVVDTAVAEAVDTAVAESVGEDPLLPATAVLLCTGPGGSFEAWRDAAPATAVQVERRAQGEEGVGLQLYTSGTTGNPKGVMLSDVGWNACAATHCDLLDMDRRSVQLIALPLFHIGGLVLALASMRAGSVTVLSADADPKSILELIRAHEVSHLPTVPTLLAAILDAAQQAGDPLSSLRAICYGSSPMTDTLLSRAMSMLSADLLTGYGMTETTATVTYLGFDDHRRANRPGASAPERRRLRSVGRAGPHVAVKIVDPETLDERPQGCDGEILVSGPQAMRGYWNRPEAAADVLLPGGWVRTGDGGHLDEDGYLFLTDRIKDMIITGGENVYPAEVENVIAGLPGIVEVAVIGVPDQRWGETVKAVAVRRPGFQITAEEVIAHCRGSLAHYKCPSTVEWRDALPRNSLGKILKHALRQR